MKKPLISVVVNTLNEEDNLPRCLKSVQSLADEIVVVDMYSDDRTRKIARKFGARVFLHKKVGYVEPARNFAIGKARGKWVLVLDADEKVTPSLAKRLREIVTKRSENVDFVLIPRKNIIFGKWIQNSRWWPDYLPRFFKQGKVIWPKQIHQKPELKGNIYTLPDAERYALTHYNYESLEQFLERSWRYAEVRAEELVKENKYRLSVGDLVLKPTGEFLSRLFSGEGYKDGIHGLALAILQSYSTALIYLKVWEKQHYEEKVIEEKKLKDIFSRLIYEIDYWRSRWWLERACGLRHRILEIIFKMKRFLLKAF